MNGIAKYRGINATATAAKAAESDKTERGPSNADKFKASKIVLLDNPEQANGRDLAMGLHYATEALTKDETASVAIFAILYACAVKGESIEVAKERIAVLTEKFGNKFGIRGKATDLPELLVDFRAKFAKWDGEIKLPKVK